MEFQAVPRAAPSSQRSVAISKKENHLHSAFCYHAIYYQLDETEPPSCPPEALFLLVMFGDNSLPLLDQRARFEC